MPCASAKFLQLHIYAKFWSGLKWKIFDFNSSQLGFRDEKLIGILAKSKLNENDNIKNLEKFPHNWLTFDKDMRKLCFIHFCEQTEEFWDPTTIFVHIEQKTKHLDCSIQTKGTELHWNTPHTLRWLPFDHRYFRQGFGSAINQCGSEPRVSAGSG